MASGWHATKALRRKRTLGQMELPICGLIEG